MKAKNSRYWSCIDPKPAKIPSSWVSGFLQASAILALLMYVFTAMLFV